MCNDCLSSGKENDVLKLNVLLVEESMHRLWYKKNTAIAHRCAWYMQICAISWEDLQNFMEAAVTAPRHVTHILHIKTHFSFKLYFGWGYDYDKHSTGEEECI
jgi:hypothetical protein